MRRVYGALLVAMLVVCRVCAESRRVRTAWLAGCMGFVWVHTNTATNNARFSCPIMPWTQVFKPPIVDLHGSAPQAYTSLPAALVSPN